MAMQASWSQVEEIVKKAKGIAERAKEHAKAVGEQAGEVAGQVVHGLEVTGVAFGFGFMRGYFGDVRFLGIPVDVLFGTLAQLTGVGLIMSGNATARGLAPHVGAIGAGAIASATTAFGASIGADLRAKKGSAASSGGGWNVVAGGAAPQPLFAQPAGLLPAPRSPLTQDELVAASQYRAVA